MTMSADLGAERRFVPVILPWLVAAAALALYLFTLNTWVSLESLPQVATVSGWTWQAQLSVPVYWLVTLPFRLLPVRIIPLVLNLFSALCASLTLALLARSIALLPHDRTHAQREKVQGEFGLLTIPSAWLPPVLAAVVCGLQLTFWENATAASREMFDLLLFAYVIRCLLEYRIFEEQSWLTRAALVYGAAMANNWAMVGFFPLFLAALIWIKGLGFFNTRFLAPMFFWGLAGTLFYLLLPLVQSHSDLASISFWQALRINLVGQKNTLLFFFKNYRQIIALLGLTSLLPVFIMSIRWASYFGDTSRIGAGLATFMFHVVNALFLLVCIWVALDPPCSPRNKMPFLAFLSFYYLAALAVGYCSGYFLLICSGKAAGRRTPFIILFSKRLATLVVWLLLLLAPVALLARNLAQIRLNNGPLLHQFASLLTKGLPSRAVLLSDNPRRLLLVESALAQSGTAKEYIFLDTVALANPVYHRFLKKRHPQSWPDNPPKDRLETFDPVSLVQLVTSLSKSNRLFYLHPSFGYYFEFLYPEPHGFVSELLLYPTNLVMAPPRTQAQLVDNISFWAQADRQTLAPLAKTLAPPGRPKDPTLKDLFMTRAHLSREPNRTAVAVGWMCSLPLVAWGVELQKSGQLEKARSQFERALDLNPDNVVAYINLRCNTNLQAGLKISSHLPRSIEDEFGQYRNWDQVLSDNGPFDDPNFCYEQGRVFVGGGLYRQAFHQFARVAALDPDRLDARLWLAQLYVMSRRPDDAMNVVQEIHAHAQSLGLGPTNLTTLLYVETSAQLARNNPTGAEAAVQAALEGRPGDEELLATASQVYLNYGNFSNALTTIQDQLKLAPDNPNTLVNEGFVFLQLNYMTQAVASLTRVLELPTNNPYLQQMTDVDRKRLKASALLNRAIATMRAGLLDEAQSDYEALQKELPPTAFQIYYGLQEIAYRKKDTNAAIRNCQLYLANAPTNTAEAKVIASRLKELKPQTQ